MSLPTPKQELSDLLERVPLLLHADQQKPIEASIVAAIEAFDLSGYNLSDFTPRERVALGNYYFTTGKPVEALQHYWSAVKDGDESIKAVASNNAGVTHFGFCPGQAIEILEGVM